MNISRPLRLITLVTFLPLATGCSTTRSIAIGDDPGGAEDPLRTEERLAVTGYLDAEGGRQDWNGFVQAAGVDSLEFTRVRRARGNAPPRAEVLSLRLARNEVSGLLVDEPQKGRTSLLVVGVVLGVLALGLIALMNMELDLDLASGYQGS